MYLQITTKCNMTCAHCCYSCTMRGKHMDYSTALDAIAFARNHTESIYIGGGEPTLHPRFFDILRHCLNDFDSVWMATNGSQTKTMLRLANIIDGCDYDSFDLEDYCTCDPDDRDDCYCEPEGVIYKEDKLSVALSQDHFHDDIDRRVVDLWTRRAGHHHSHFEIRNVSHNVAGMGRAKKPVLAGGSTAYAVTSSSNRMVRSGCVVASGPRLSVTFGRGLRKSGDVRFNPTGLTVATRT